MRNILFQLIATACIVALVAPISAVLGIVLTLAAISYIMPKEIGMVRSTLPVDLYDALTSELLTRTQNRLYAPTFLRSFFRTENVSTLNVAFRTKMNKKKVAVDVNIQTKGELHKRQVGSFDAVQPPMYWKYTELQEKDLYTGIMADGSATPIDKIYDFASVIDYDLDEIHDEVQRAIELQCSQVLNNGVLQFNVNDNINYGRLVGSMVTASNLWNTANGDPYADLGAGAKWIRDNSSNNSSEMHVIMGSSAFTAFASNAKVIARKEKSTMSLEEIFRGRPIPQGGVYYGTYYVDGGITMHVWAYDQVYEDASGNKVNFWPTDKVVIIPSNNELTGVEAAVKFLPGTPNVSRYREGYIHDFADFNQQVHYFHYKRRSIVVPQEINEIFTITVV